MYIASYIEYFPAILVACSLYKGVRSRGGPEAGGPPPPQLFGTLYICTLRIMVPPPPSHTHMHIKNVSLHLILVL